MTMVYDKLGLRFMYPESWEVVDEDPLAEPRTVTVQNDTGAFWSITLYGLGIDPVSLAGTVLTALRQEYDELEAETVAEKIGQAQATGYDVHFYVQQLVAAASIRAFQFDGRIILVLCQAEDREFDRLEQVFQAMTLSLMKK
jgi:hypothetical protein